jgi:hypothetical protein
MKQQRSAAEAQQAGQPPPPPPVSPEQIEEVKKTLESPTVEEVQAILNEDATRGFRIDIESDSTVRGDVVRNQQQMGTFVQGLGAFMQSAGPAVEAGVMPVDVAGEMIGAFARTMKLGRQAEDAIDRWIDGLRKQAQNPQPKPDPEADKHKLRWRRSRPRPRQTKDGPAKAAGHAGRPSGAAGQVRHGAASQAAGHGAEPTGGTGRAQIKQQELGMRRQELGMKMQESQVAHQDHNSTARPRRACA